MENNDIRGTENQRELLVELTSDIVSAYVGNHNVPVSELPGLIRQTYEALSLKATGDAAVEETPAKPAVPVGKSIDKDGNYIVCLEDGLRFKSLKRHLSSAYGMTPDDYRQKWGLPSDYPMVAPNYSKIRSEMARSLGLGRMGRVRRSAA